MADENGERPTVEGARRITRPNAGEAALSEWTAHGVDVCRLPDDFLALRVSLGQANPALIGEVDVDAYLVFRGDRERVLALLKRAVAAMEAAPSNVGSAPTDAAEQSPQGASGQETP